MTENMTLLMGVAVLLAALTAFGMYRWRRRRRIHEITNWIKSYLLARCGEMPEHLHINCTDDRLWPVLVTFDRTRQGTRHSLQFRCSEARSTFVLLSEKEEKR